jgi:hypothetical protein
MLAEGLNVFRFEVHATLAGKTLADSRIRVVRDAVLLPSTTMDR